MTSDTSCVELEWHQVWYLISLLTSSHFYFVFSYADDVPLIKGEFLYEPQIGPHDLGAEPILGIAAEEHDSWSPSVPKEVVKSLKDKQVIIRPPYT